MSTYETWNLDVSCEVAGSCVILTCGNTMKPVVSSEWVEWSGSVTIELDDLTDEMLRALCPSL